MIILLEITSMGGWIALLKSRSGSSQLNGFVSRN
jgi:hypothetical protein